MNECKKNEMGLFELIGSLNYQERNAVAIHLELPSNQQYAQVFRLLLDQSQFPSAKVEKVLEKMKRPGKFIGKLVEKIIEIGSTTRKATLPSLVEQAAYAAEKRFYSLAAYLGKKALEEVREHGNVQEQWAVLTSLEELAMLYPLEASLWRSVVSQGMVQEEIRACAQAKHIRSMVEKNRLESSGKSPEMLLKDLEDLQQEGFSLESKIEIKRAQRDLITALQQPPIQRQKEIVALLKEAKDVRLALLYLEEYQILFDHALTQRDVVLAEALLDDIEPLQGTHAFQNEKLGGFWLGNALRLGAGGLDYFLANLAVSRLERKNMPFPRKQLVDLLYLASVVAARQGHWAVLERLQKRFAAMRRKVAPELAAGSRLLRALLAQHDGDPNEVARHLKQWSKLSGKPDPPAEAEWIGIAFTSSPYSFHLSLAGEDQNEYFASNL